MVITRIAPLSAAKIAAVLYACIGVLAGAALSLMSMIGAMGPATHMGGFRAMILGFGAIIALPILYAVFGFIGALIVASVYNAVAGAIGGVEVEVR
jgi:hypothetical protein